ncbi:hypothetical protein M8818_003419 [Zalaria obscura]|uniref:Uncharacterized protein n=1 Tax=Zalaria obscura TaxID=2024903 RepID=A0ACC3SEV5_9PEZI
MHDCARALMKACMSSYSHIHSAGQTTVRAVPVTGWGSDRLCRAYGLSREVTRGSAEDWHPLASRAGADRRGRVGYSRQMKRR